MELSTEKPVVRIRDAKIVQCLRCGENQYLTGTPVDHPRQSLNGYRVQTSRILVQMGESPGALIETENTIYEVQNWLTEEDDGN